MHNEYFYHYHISQELTDYDIYAIDFSSCGTAITKTDVPYNKKITHFEQIDKVIDEYLQTNNSCRNVRISISICWKRFSKLYWSSVYPCVGKGHWTFTKFNEVYWNLMHLERCTNLSNVITVYYGM